MTICKCDPDAVLDPEAIHPSMASRYPSRPVQTWNTRAHIKQTLKGHWPIGDENEVTCELCDGVIKRESAHKAALNREPLKT